MAQGRATDPQLCWAAIQMLSMGCSVAYTAECLRLGERNVETIRNRFVSTGDPTVPKRISTAQKQRRKLTDEDVQFLQASIQKRPDIYLKELAEDILKVCGVQLSESGVWRSLHRAGFTRKQITKLAIERNEARRDAFLLDIGMYSPEQLVFVDESAVDRRTTHRTFGWAPSGQRAEMHGAFVRGTRYSLLPALSLDGIIYSRIVEGSFTGETFFDFVANLLERMQPFPNANSVLVMDNCAIHKVQGIRELVEAKGVRLVYLPPYSPDYNLIELAFSAIKAYLRQHTLEVNKALSGKPDQAVLALLLLNRAVFSVTPTKARAWFKHCGYLN